MGKVETQDRREFKAPQDQRANQGHKENQGCRATGVIQERAKWDHRGLLEKMGNLDLWA